MAYDLDQLLEGLDSNTLEQVKTTIADNSKKLEAKLFIDGDGEHFVPAPRLAEVVEERNTLKDQLKDTEETISTLQSQVEEGSEAAKTIDQLKADLEAQTQISRLASIKSELSNLVTDSIAPIEDLVGFMDLEKVQVGTDGKVSGLDEQVAAVREARKYLFKEVSPETPSPEKGAGTGDPGNPAGVGAGAKVPKQVGTFGKQLAQKVAKAQPSEQTDFFK